MTTQGGLGERPAEESGVVTTQRTVGHGVFLTVIVMLGHLSLFVIRLQLGTAKEKQFVKNSNVPISIMLLTDNLFHQTMWHFREATFDVRL